MEINAAAVSLALSARGVAVFPSVTLLAHPSHSVMPALVHRPSVPEMQCAADNKRIFLTFLNLHLEEFYGLQSALQVLSMFQVLFSSRCL